MVHHGDDGAPLIRLRPLPCETAVNGGDSAVRFRWKIKEEARWESRAKIIFQHSCQHSFAKKKIIIFQNRAFPLLPPSPLPPPGYYYFSKQHALFLNLASSRRGAERNTSVSLRARKATPFKIDILKRQATTAGSCVVSYI